MEEAYFKAADLKYFVAKANGNAAGALGSYGLDALFKIRYAQEKMIVRLGLIHEQLVANAAQLIAAGLKQLDIEGIAAVRDELNAMNSQQEIFRRSIPLATAARIEKYNLVYSYVQRLSRLAKVVFRPGSAELKRYKLPKRK